MWYLNYLEARQAHNYVLFKIMSLNVNQMVFALMSLLFRLAKLKKKKCDDDMDMLDLCQSIIQSVSQFGIFFRLTANYALYH